MPFTSPEQLIEALQNYCHDTTTKQFFSDFDPHEADAMLRSAGFRPQMASYQSISEQRAEPTINMALSEMAAGRQTLGDAIVAPIVMGKQTVICGIARWVEPSKD